MILVMLWFATIVILALLTAVGAVTSIVGRHLNLLFVIALASLMVCIAIEGILLLKINRSVTTYAAYWSKQTAETPGEIIYIAMGDSAAQGIGASSVQTSYVNLIAEQITHETGKRVRIINLSKSGGKIADVLNDQLPQLAKLHPDIVTVDIGSNDITANTPANQVIAQSNTLLRQLQKYPTVFATLPDFMWGAQQQRVSLINNAVMEAGTRYGVTIADLHTPTHLKMWAWNEFAADGFHPSDTGHQTWAKALLPSVLKIVTASQSR